MPDLSRRRLAHGTAVLSLQMQRQHKVRAPRVPNGMALALAKETLRALQNLFPFHEALRPADALHGSFSRLRQAGCPACAQESVELGKMEPGHTGMARLGALEYADRLALAILPRRWRLDRLARNRAAPCLAGSGAATYVSRY